MDKCEKCGKLTQKLTPFKRHDRLLCSDCLHKEAATPEVCPNCGHIIQEADLVGIRLNHKDKSVKEIAAGVEATAIICPKCRILFFDEFQYNVIQGLK